MTWCWKLVGISIAAAVALVVGRSVGVRPHPSVTDRAASYQHDVARAAPAAVCALRSMLRPQTVNVESRPWCARVPPRWWQSVRGHPPKYRWLRISSVATRPVEDGAVVLVAAQLQPQVRGPEQPVAVSWSVTLHRRDGLWVLAGVA